MTVKGYLVHPMLCLALIRRPVRAWPRVRCRVFFRKPKPGPGSRGSTPGSRGGGRDSRQGWRGGGTGDGRGKRGGGARGLFRNGPRRGILMTACLLLQHITYYTPRRDCQWARGAASRCGKGFQRRALSGPNSLLFSDLLGETGLCSLGGIVVR